jgi:trehalose 6-phosphate synthase
VGRIIIVSNRVSSLAAPPASAGGLAVAMRAALEGKSAIWFGWSGKVVESAPGAPRSIRERGITRVLIDLAREDYEKYYVGFANRALWPLFHYRIDLVECSHDAYAGYRRVNEYFARQLEALIEPDDVIWVHDYQLILVGAALRARGVRNRIGFFLHTPFPAPEVLATLPMHEDIIRGLCDHDVVGFQTEIDLHAFTGYLIREAKGIVGDDGRVAVFGRSLHAAAFPISIDPEDALRRAIRAMSLPQCQRLRESLAGRKMIIGVDRLDYSKGLLKRFEAVELLLERHSDYSRRIVVLQIAPPTRGEVPEYQQLRSALDRITGHINGRFADPDLLPVRYLNRHVGQDALFGFYRLSAIGLVTPLRDGMNLVAKEFIASQSPDDPGVLVLSRFAGAARELDAAIIVNPYDAAAVASALERALNMPIEERRERHRTLMEVLRRFDINYWRESFLRALEKPAEPHYRAIGDEANGHGTALAAALGGLQ